MRKIPFALSLAALSFAACSPPVLAADSLTAGKTVEGRLAAGDRPSDSGGRSHDYTLRLEAGQTVAISARSADFDTVVIVFTPDGEKLGENDDREGGGTDSLLVVAAPEAGDYTVRVNSLPLGDGHLGAYTLRASVIGDD